jgi:cbb3-type cytochrome oxidase subunit 3
MKNWRKGSTLLLMGLMITSALAAFTAPVLADTEVESNGIEIDFYAQNMTDELTWFANAAGTNPYNLGEGDGLNDDACGANSCTLQIVVEVIDTNDLADFYLNITDYTQSVFDFPDTVSGTAGTQVSVGPYSGNFGDLIICDFQFDVLATNVALGASSSTLIEISWDYISDPGGTNTNVNGDVEGWIYLCSIFDPANAIDEELPNIADDNDDARFEAGDNFEASKIPLHNYELGLDHISDLTCTLTEPGNGVTLSGDRNVCMIPGGMNAGAGADALYRTDVDPNTAPGEYWGTADIEYTRADSDLTVTEAALDLLWEVDFNFRDIDPFESAIAYSEFQCRATDVNITDDGTGTARQVDWVGPTDGYIQSDFSDRLITVEVVIENNGNSPIYNAEFVLEPSAWPFFRNPKFFWVSAGTLDFDSIAVTGVDMDVGESVTFMIEVIVVKEIPIGEHRLPIIYDGFWFNDGSLGEATGFYGLNGFDGVPLDGDANVDDLELIFSITVTDPYVDCAVTDASMTAPEAADKGDLTSETISVTVHNYEMYDFIDVLVTADFTGTPFYAPLIDTTTLDWPIPTARNYLVDAYDANWYVPYANWGGGGDMTVNFLVDTDPNMVPDRYPFSITITAIINQTLEQVVTTITAGVEINYVGYGPEVYITAFTADDIVPGDYWDLMLTISNQGDDTLRDVWITIPPDDTEEYDWDTIGSEAQFKEQFDWTSVFENWSVVTGPIEIPDGMFYTMESLDVDNVREIIEINLYIDGVYSDPGSTINMIRIIDLAPGASFDVTFTMIADKDMVNGKPYNVDVWIRGVDSEGEPYNLNQTLEVMTSLPGDHYNPVELDWFSAGLKALALFLFFIIVIAILLWVYNKFKGEPEEEEEEEFDFEEEPSFEEPAPKPPEKTPEELVEP